MMLTCKHDRGSMVFALEQLSDILPEVEVLWRLHWDDSEAYRHELGYKPDREGFLAYDKAGTLRLYTAREGRRLVGQVGFLVYRSRHTQTKTASEDFFYLLPEARGKGAAIGLFRFALQDLRDDGVEQVTASEKLNDDARRLFEKCGMTFVARQYSLVFKET